MNKEELLSKCKYYKQESVPPFEQGSKSFFFWRVEQMWVHQAIKDEAYLSVIRSAFAKDFTEADYGNKPIDITLLACMYREYMRENQYDKSGFLKYIEAY